MKSAVWKFFFV